MRRLTRIVFDESLSIQEQSTDKVRHYAGDVNVFEFLAPLSVNFSVYGMAKAIDRHQRTKDKARQRTKYIGEETYNGETYNVWHFVPSSFVYSTPTARTLEINAVFEAYSDERMLGSEYFGEEENINTALKDKYPDAEADDIVRVMSEDSDWEFDGTDWNELEEYASIYVERNTSYIATFNFERSRDAGVPDHEITPIEEIYSELDSKATRSEINNDFYDKVDSDNRFLNTSGDSMNNDLNMDGNKIKKVADGTDKNDAVNKSQLDQVDDKNLGINGENTMKANLPMGGKRIFGLADPEEAQDATTKKYVDGEADGVVAQHNEDEEAHANQLDPIRTSIEALQGSLVFVGQVESTTEEIKNDKSLLTTFITNEENRDPQRGDTVKDTDGNEWYYKSKDYTTDSEWRFLGQGFISLATETNDGLMSKEKYTKLLELYTRDNLDALLDDIDIALNDRYTKTEVDDLLDQLKSIYGWEDSDLGTLADT